LNDKDIYHQHQEKLEKGNHSEREEHRLRSQQSSRLRKRNSPRVPGDAEDYEANDDFYDPEDEVRAFEEEDLEDERRPSGRRNRRQQDMSDLLDAVEVPAKINEHYDPNAVSDNPPIEEDEIAKLVREIERQQDYQKEKEDRIASIKWEKKQMRRNLRDHIDDDDFDKVPEQKKKKKKKKMRGDPPEDLFLPDLDDDIKSELGNWREKMKISRPSRSLVAEEEEEYYDRVPDHDDEDDYEALLMRKRPVDEDDDDYLDTSTLLREHERRIRKKAPPKKKVSRHEEEMLKMKEEVGDAEKQWLEEHGGKEPTSGDFKDILNSLAEDTEGGPEFQAKKNEVLEKLKDLDADWKDINRGFTDLHMKPMTPDNILSVPAEGEEDYDEDENVTLEDEELFAKWIKGLQDADTLSEVPDLPELPKFSNLYPGEEYVESIRKANKIVFFKPARDLVNEILPQSYCWARMLVDIANTMSLARRRRFQVSHRRQVLWDRHRERVRVKYAAKSMARDERRLVRRQIFLSKAKKDPNWFYYPSLRLWIHRDSLENPHVRGVFTAVWNNPSYTRKQKKEAIESTLLFIKNANTRSPEWIAHRKFVYGPLLRTPNKTNPDLDIDPTFVVPKTYDELIRRAEAEMTFEDRAGRYGPPLNKVHPKPLDY